MVSVGMTTLVEFLRARLDEDEAEMRLSAQDAAEDQAWMDNPPSGKPGKRFLDDLEAKRQIVDMDECIACEIEDQHCNLHDVLRLLAFPYAAHPDYDPSWRPAEVTA